MVICWIHLCEYWYFYGRGIFYVHHENVQWLVNHPVYWPTFFKNKKNQVIELVAPHGIERLYTFFGVKGNGGYNVIVSLWDHSSHLKT